MLDVKMASPERSKFIPAEAPPTDPLENLDFQLTKHREEWLAITKNLLKRSGLKGGIDETADDLLQNAWIKVSNWIKENPDAVLVSLETFLYVALKRLAIDINRRDKSVHAIPVGGANFSEEIREKAIEDALHVEEAMTPEERIDADRLYDFVLHQGMMGGKKLQDSVNSSTLERTATAVRMRLEGYTAEETAKYLSENDPEFAKKYNLDTPDGIAKAMNVIDRSISRLLQYANTALEIDQPPGMLVHKDSVRREAKKLKKSTDTSV